MSYIIPIQERLQRLLEESGVVESHQSFLKKEKPLTYNYDKCSIQLADSSPLVEDTTSPLALLREKIEFGL